MWGGGPQNKRKDFTQIVATHLGKKFELVKGVIVSVSGSHLKKPVTQRLLCNASSFCGTELQYPLWVAPADGSVLAKLTGLFRKKKKKPKCEYEIVS